MQKIVIALFVILLPFATRCQVFPAEGGKLNYRIVGFTFPATPVAGKCMLEIAAGTYYSEDSFKAAVIQWIPCKGSKVMAEVPAFGQGYTWRVVNQAGKDIKQRNIVSFRHFRTLSSPVVDTATTRLRVVSNEGQYKEGFVFMDRTKVLYNMKGQPVWFMPSIDGVSEEVSTIRDLKLTETGTITFLQNDWPYEINYNNDILWKGPRHAVVSGDSIEFFHHEVTKLKNGHYMVLGSEHIPYIPPELALPFVNGQEATQTTKRSVIKRPFGTIIEYDKAGKLVWWWKSSTYYKDSEIYDKRPLGDLYDPHENAFYFNEKAKEIYISFKNINQVIKIKYPEGTILNWFGSKAIPNENNFFCDQHAVKYSPSGYVYLFNNNVCNAGATPTIQILKEHAAKQNGLEKIWEFKCPIFEGQRSTTAKAFVTNGGNVIELPGHNLFVSMSSPYAHVFIVNRDKKILWSAIPERWNASDKKWDIITQYRGSIINTNKEMEKLVFNAGR